MDELHAGSQVHMKRATIVEKACRRERQHWAQTLAPGLDQMRRNFGYARCVLRCHSVSDQGVNRFQIDGQKIGQSFEWAYCNIIRAHHGHVTSLDKRGRLPLSHGL